MLSKILAGLGLTLAWVKVIKVIKRLFGYLSISITA